MEEIELLVFRLVLVIEQRYYSIGIEGQYPLDLIKPWALTGSIKALNCELKTSMKIKTRKGGTKLIRQHVSVYCELDGLG